MNVDGSTRGGGVPSGWWAERIDRRLGELTAADRWRVPRTFDALGTSGTLVDEDRQVVSFGSNDYLGLASHADVLAAAHQALDRWGAGSGASRLITGSRPVHRELECALAAWKGTPAAMCFPTGFAANLSVLSVLATAGTRILSDELNHASIIDGCRSSRAEVEIFRHADPDHVEHLLSGDSVPSVVVTDSVFSMDGDQAPVVALADSCRRHGAMLVLDEAHAVLGPVLGPEVTDGLVVVRVGTLSKTLGSLGGFVAAPAPVIQLLVNLARPYIFTTAPSPANAAAALAALTVLRSPEGEQRVTRLRRLVDRVRPGHPSPIVPLVLGSETRAIEASAELLDRGLWVPAIRPPTVPPGTSRLRIALSSDHTDAQVDSLIEALAYLGAPASAGAIRAG